ncbi:LCP family protein [Dehalobacterium formicoaceticum]|uniref:LCP family protein n=1 Tax=Dehalobacterium formicoaceticum TaxID=51515 RepID=UPI0031F6CF45
MEKLDDEFWGNNGTYEINKHPKTPEKNAKFFLMMLFCMAFFLWGGFQLSYLYPLEITEARPQPPVGEESPPAVVPDEESKGKEIILVVGSDSRNGEPARSDTIILVFLDKEQKSVGVLSIPRDTYVNIAGKNLKTKINHAHAYGGIEMTKDTVEEFLDIKIDRYVDMNFKGFVKLIDALGGIEMDVEKRMYKPSENINLKKGEQKLDGEQALAYVRFRDDGKGDLGRVERQLKFISVLSDRLTSLNTLWKIPQLVGIFQDNVETDLTLKEMLSLANTYKNFDAAKLRTDMLPGEGEYINDVSYFIHYPKGSAQLVDELQAGVVPVENKQEETQKGLE